MIEFAAVVLAVIALVRLSRLERDLRALERRLGGIEFRPPAPSLTPTPLSPPAAPVSETPVPTSVPPAPVTPAPSAATEMLPAAPPPPLTVEAPPAAPAMLRDDAAANQAAAGGLPADDEDTGTIERSIGERYLLYAGMIVLVLAVASFLRYAFQNDWLSPTVRVLLGAAGGIGLAVAGRRIAAVGYRYYGLIVSGGGLVMLFLSIYAAFAFYALIGQAAAFVLLAAVAAVAAVFADREASLPLAVLAVCGGFATPFLVGGRGDAQLTLFSYVAALIAATAYLAHRRSWPWLMLTTFVLTVMTVWTWALLHYTDAAYLRTELFLVIYCALFLIMVRAARRGGETHPAAVTVLWAAPTLFHLASLAILQSHPVGFLVYLLLASAVVVAVSVESGWAPLRLIGWAAIFVPLVAWLSMPNGREWLVGSTAGPIGIWILFLLPLAWLLRTSGRLAPADLVLVHASGLGLLLALWVARGDMWPPLGMAAVALAVAGAHLLLWLVFRASPESLHWLATSGALYAAAAGMAFEGRWLTIMWAAEAAAVTIVGVRHGASLVRTTGVPIFLLALYSWFLGSPPAPSRDAIPLVNAHALAAIVLIAMLYAAAWVLRGVTETGQRRERAVLVVAASVLTVLIVSIEIWAYWSARPEGAIDYTFARQLMLSAWWAAYAAGLVAVGIRYHYPPVRYFAIALFGFTLLKVFAVDIWWLEGGYRVVGFLAVGSILLLASFLYQRMARK